MTRMKSSSSCFYLLAACIIYIFCLDSTAEGLLSTHLNRQPSSQSLTDLGNTLRSKKLTGRNRYDSRYTFRLHPSTGSNTQLKSLPHERNASKTKSTSNGNNVKSKLLATLCLSFGAIITLAKSDLIGPYPDRLILMDMGISILSTILALIFVKTITALTSNGMIQPRDSRKIIHSLSAPLFMLFWPLFSSAVGARLFAATVPLLQAMRLWLAALDKGGDDGSELAAAISRSGDTKEALGGPFIYVVVLFFAIITCFKDSFAGMMALSAMAAGDGMADLFGRRFGKKNKWFFNQDKSMAGTAAFIIGSSLCSIGLGYFLQVTGAIPLNTPFVDLAVKFVTISVLSAFIELIPFGDDNWSVPIGAYILSLLLL